jgi:internalin A
MGQKDRSVLARVGLILSVGVFLLCCGQRQPLGVYTPVADLQFADSRLAACVAEAAQKHQWPDAGHVTALRCNNTYGGRISKLDGIENLVNLERLDLAHNAVTDTELLASLAQLKFVDLSYNAIDTFRSLGTRHVTYLNLDHNKITRVDWLDDFLSLESLSLSHNRIADISPLTGKATLRELDLSSNDLADVTALSDLMALRHLDLSRNRLTDVAALGALIGLESLIISSNPGLDIGPLAALTDLSELDLDDDDLSDVGPIGALTKVQRLSLHGNRITSIEPLLGLGGLTHIDLTDNPDLSCSELQRLVENFGANVVQPSTCAVQTGKVIAPSQPSRRHSGMVDGMLQP